MCKTESLGNDLKPIMDTKLASDTELPAHCAKLKRPETEVVGRRHRYLFGAGQDLTLLTPPLRCN